MLSLERGLLPPLLVVVPVGLGAPEDTPEELPDSVEIDPFERVEAIGYSGLEEKLRTTRWNRIERLSIP